MSKTNIEVLNKTKENSNNLALKASAIGAVALAAVGLKMAQHNAQPQEPALNGPHIEYTVGPQDTVSTILQRAYPDRDWRSLTDVVESQLPKPDRHAHIVRAGEVLTFGQDAKIGKLIQGDTGSHSANG